MKGKKPPRGVLRITIDAFCEAAQAEIKRLARLRDAPPKPKRRKKRKSLEPEPEPHPGLVRWRQARTLRSSGLTLQKIADQMQISRQRVHQMLNNPEPRMPTRPKLPKR